MRIGFLTRKDASMKWGGDSAVLHNYVDGLRACDVEVEIAADAFALVNCDLLILTNSCIVQRTILEEIEMIKKPFAVLGFHEDILQYYTIASGFASFTLGCLGYGLPTDNGMDYDIEKLFTMPHLAAYYGEPPKRSTLYNLEYTRHALCWIANSPTEAATMQRDCPGCRTVTIPIAPNFLPLSEPDDRFLEWTHLKSREYILQVGRLEMRKNQLGSILATRSLDLPLVFISTLSPTYSNYLLEAAARWRGAPTLIISQNLPPATLGAARILPMPHGEKLSEEMLFSAYAHAGLHLHPAFQELPGATYLESVGVGTPTVASSWSTIADYFYDPCTGDAALDGRIAYCEPHHLNLITQNIEKLFGKSFPPLWDHPALRRRPVDMARELLEQLTREQ
jgi:hypothetical protein